MYESLQGKPAPELSIFDARGVDKNVRLADFRGRWVALEFWGLHCGPCVTESLPALARFYQEHAADRGRFEILAICNCKEHPATIQEYDRLIEPVMNESWGGKPLPFPVLLDRGKETNDTYGIESYPTTLLVDPEGNLVGEVDLAKLDGSFATG